MSKELSTQRQQGNVAASNAVMYQSGQNNIQGYNVSYATNGSCIATNGSNITYNDSNVILHLLDIISEQNKIIKTVVNTLLEAKAELQANDIDRLLKTIMNNKVTGNGQDIRKQVF